MLTKLQSPAQPAYLALAFVLGCGGVAATPDPLGGVDANAIVDATVNEASVAIDSNAETGVDAAATLDADVITGDANVITADANPANEASGDACTDVQTDPLNCGTCGHDCFGALCVAGACGVAPTLLASGQSPASLAVDATNVYWVNELKQPAGSAGHSQVMRCAIAGCNDRPATLWDGLYPVGSLFVEQGGVWWPTGPGGLVSAPYGQNPNVLSCAVGGCAGTPTSLLTSRGNIQAFTADATRAYWASVDGNVSACSLSGCGGLPTTIFTDSYMVLAVAVNTAGVYWADEGPGLWSCPLTGCTAAGPTKLAAVNGLAEVLAVDERRVFWIDPGSSVGGGKIGPVTQYLNGAVLECPIAGCNGSPTVLATYPSWLAGGALALDATDVYWSTEDGSGRYGEIVRCAIAGCGGKPTPLAITTGRSTTNPNAWAAQGLAVDATHVYWSDLGRGAVMMMAK